MPSVAYEEIVQRLDALESSEFLVLITEIRTCLATRPKQTLKEFWGPQGRETFERGLANALREEWDREF